MDLDHMLRRFRGPLMGLLRSFGAPWRDAEELAQDTFAEAYLSWPRFRGDPDDDAQVGAWLRGIAFRLHSHWSRRRRPVELVDADLADPDEGPEQDHATQVRRAIERLPSPQRAVVWMHYLDDCRVRDVAAILGVTEKTVESRLYQARKRLRELLAQTEADAAPRSGS